MLQVSSTGTATGCQTVEQPVGTQEVHVGKRAIKVQSLDAGGEADEVVQETPAVRGSPEFTQLVDRVDPPEVELGIAGDQGDELDAAKAHAPRVLRVARGCSRRTRGSWRTPAARAGR